MTKILWASIFCITLFSCSVKEEVVVENVQKITVKSRIKTRASTSDGYDHLQNPYSISVMQSVYDTYSTDSVKINPTDVYLRIQPRDSSELDYLLNESGLKYLNILWILTLMMAKNIMTSHYRRMIFLGYIP